MMFPKITVRIADHPDENVIEIDGTRIDNIKSIKFEGSALNFSSVTIELAAPDIEFDGEIPIYVMLGGRKYYLLYVPESHKDREPGIEQAVIARNRGGL